MKKITEISPQKKNAGRCNVYLDGEFYCGLALETVVKNRLKVGMEIGEEQLSRIQEESEFSAALDKAMTYISGAYKTERQVGDYLRGKGYVPSVCEGVIEKLKGYGFLDDGDYARRYAESYSDKKGARLIKNELIAKGISAEHAEKAASSIENGKQAAAAVAAKYMRGKPNDRETVQKLYRHLMTKGFDYDDVRDVVYSYRDLDEN